MAQVYKQNSKQRGDRTVERNYQRGTLTVKIGKPNAHLQIRTAPDGRKYEWHSTKGFRRWIKTPEEARDE